MAGPRTHDFEFEGHRLVYAEYGAGERTVVLLPGLLLPRRMQDPLARRLAARGNRVLNLDLLGHGESDKPGGAGHYSMSRFADQAAALLDHEGIGEAVFGGTSLGANVALEVAARHPDRVRGLVLEMPVLDDGILPALVIFPPAIVGFRIAAPLLRPFTRIARRLPRIGPLRAGHLGNLSDTLVDWVSQDPRHASALLEGIFYGRAAPPREERVKIEAPALVIAHTLDPLHALSDSEAAAEELPNARLVRARSFFEMRFVPTRLSEEIADFVDECQPSPSAVGGRRPGGQRARASA